jgi:hypothetical protein
LLSGSSNFLLSFLLNLVFCAANRTSSCC